MRGDGFGESLSHRDLDGCAVYIPARLRRGLGESSSHRDLDGCAVGRGIVLAGKAGCAFPAPLAAGPLQKRLAGYAGLGESLSHRDLDGCAVGRGIVLAGKAGCAFPAPLAAGPLQKRLASYAGLGESLSHRDLDGYAVYIPARLRRGFAKRKKAETQASLVSAFFRFAVRGGFEPPVR